MTKIKLYFIFIIKFLNFSNLTIKSQNINFYNIGDINIIAICLYSL